MLKEVKAKYNLFFLLSLCLINLSCFHTREVSSDNSVSFRLSRYFVWESLVQVFSKYKLHTQDEELGIIKTEVMNDKKCWNPPHQKDRSKAGLVCRLTARLVYDRPFTTVTITKELSRKKGYLSSSQSAVKSTYLEEATLIYRLKREIYIKKKLSGYPED